MIYFFLLQSPVGNKQCQLLMVVVQLTLDTQQLSQESIRNIGKDKAFQLWYRLE